MWGIQYWWGFQGVRVWKVQEGAGVEKEGKDACGKEKWHEGLKTRTGLGFWGSPLSYEVVFVILNYMNIM